MSGTERALRAGETLTDAQIGVFRRLQMGTSPPDEPRMYTASIDRAHPAALTDGVTVPPSEGGCALTAEAAAASAIGEGVERYSASIYRDRNLQRASYGELDSALDPATVVNFAPGQIEASSVPTPLYEDGDEIQWVQGRRLADDSEVFLPAQLVYLSYDRGEEPFVRAPISTGLAAGLDRSFARRRALLEVVERDAFMVHYLTKSPLPAIRVDGREGPIGTLTDRLDRAGIDWHLLDARTDIGVPVVIAVLVDDGGGPAVTVAAAASTSGADAAQEALEEAIQTRLYQRHLRESAESIPRLDGRSPEEIHRHERLLAWTRPGAAEKLDFWTDSGAETSLGAMDSDIAAEDIASVVGREWSLYTADVTTPDVAGTGFTVVRVIAPEAQPLYLDERHRYWDTTRLASVSMARGYRDEPPELADLNEVPHPFP